MSTLAHPVLNFNPLPPAYAKNDLVSHGNPNTAECWGAYDNATGVGYGSGYVNSCIHSGSNEYVTGDTVWYNFVMASAGTIVNKDATETTGDVDDATESICPKGWILPTRKQIESNTGVSSFSPIRGGHYVNGVPYASEPARWWGSEARNGAARDSLLYDGTKLLSGNSRRSLGIYIRCVSEEKTVLDLTYMQDMTPTLADAEAFI